MKRLNLWPFLVFFFTLNVLAMDPNCCCRSASDSPYTPYSSDSKPAPSVIPGHIDPATAMMTIFFQQLSQEKIEQLYQASQIIIQEEQAYRGVFVEQLNKELNNQEVHTVDLTEAQQQAFISLENKLEKINEDGWHPELSKHQLSSIPEGIYVHGSDELSSAYDEGDMDIIRQHIQQGQMVNLFTVPTSDHNPKQVSLSALIMPKEKNQTQEGNIIIALMIAGKQLPSVAIPPEALGPFIKFLGVQLFELHPTNPQIDFYFYRVNESVAPR